MVMSWNTRLQRRGLDVRTESQDSCN